MECAQAADCVAGQACVLNKCVAGTTCQDSSECGGKVCDTDAKRCVECLTDSECAPTTQHCLQNTCRITCATDKICTPMGMLCDTVNSVCTQCLAHTDCPASSYCEGGVCKPDICDSTLSACSGNGVSACNATGNGWASASECPASQGCTAFAGVASCGGSSPPDGGNPPPLDGGNPPPPDAPITCTTSTATPCTAMPKFNGTQTMDGNGDDFCDVPSFVLNKAGAAMVHNYNNVPDTQFEVVTARVAWGMDGFHAFFDVADSSVQTVNMADPTQAIDKVYQGDSIEVFITSSDAVTGLTGTDNNSLHVTVPASGPAVSVKTSAGGAAVHATLPTAQYAQLTTSTGYAIELKLPWPGGAPASGARVRFDLALNSADSIFGTVDDMRDAQMVYYLGTGGATTCPGGAEAWCDDRVWCSTPLQQ